MKGVPNRKICQICEAHFRPTRSDAKFCSTACRMKAHRRRTSPPRSISQAQALRTKRAQTFERICKSCGALMTLDGTQRNRLYCNDACKQRHYRRTNFDIHLNP